MLSDRYKWKIYSLKNEPKHNFTKVRKGRQKVNLQSFLKNHIK